MAHSYAPLYSIVAREGGSSKIVAGLPGGDPGPFERLVQSLQAPYILLYVLHTPRGEAKAGRYQSPSLSNADFHDFMVTFGPYLSADARFDLWAYSPAEKATVVWDRHNQLFAYGPVDTLATELRSLGFSEGLTDVSFAHLHHYRPECDAQAAALLEAFDWSFSELQKADEQ